MPVSEYYKGHGREVMSSMKKKYGEERGERIFYATANKKGMNRPGKGVDTGPSKRVRRKHMGE